MKERFVLRILKPATRRSLVVKAEKEFCSINAVINKAIEAYLKKSRDTERKG